MLEVMSPPSSPRSHTLSLHFYPHCHDLGSSHYDLAPGFVQQPLSSDSRLVPHPFFTLQTEAGSKMSVQSGFPPLSSPSVLPHWFCGLPTAPLTG